MSPLDLRRALPLCLLLVASLLTGSTHAQLQFAPATQLVIPGGPSEGGPALSSDNLTLYFHSDLRPGLGGFDIWRSTRATPSGSFGSPVNLGAPINTSSLEGNEKISQDGLSLYFNSDRPGTAGDLDIYLSTRATTSDPFGTPVRLDSLNTAFRDGTPDISADGLSIVFITNKPGGFGLRDIYMATRATTADAFGSIVNLGATVNTAGEERFPSLAPDALSLVFASDRPGGLGNYDLWMTSRASLADPWGTAVNLGSNVNSVFDEDNSDIAWDGASIVFGSNRSGGTFHIFQSAIVPEPSTIALAACGLCLVAFRNRRRRGSAINA
jgi:Tol biopolymer transport system component